MRSSSKAQATEETETDSSIYSDFVDNTKILKTLLIIILSHPFNLKVSMIVVLTWLH